MKTIVRRIAMLFLLAAFLVSAATVTFVKRQYRISDALYAEATERFTSEAPAVNAARDGDGTSRPGRTENAPQEEGVLLEYAPISVDFEALREVNDEIVGWIYCEDSVINYPIVQASDNDYYLHRNYDRTYNVSGSIFVEAGNRPEFADCNTILYGHHMNNGSMFASLDRWAKQEYYERHPVMWLLTPEQDYKVVLFSGYTTSAFSESYEIRREADESWPAYLAKLVEQSDFQADVDLTGCEQTIMLSTCAYVFDFARTVVHGALLPVARPA